MHGLRAIGLVQIVRVYPTMDDADRWHAIDGGETAARLGVDPESGLSSESVSERRRRYGENRLPEPRPRTVFEVFLQQFRNPLIYLLMGAGGLAFALGEVSDGIVILVVVVLNATIGAIQEGRAEHALAALRRLATQRTRVLRDGQERMIDAFDLVPGDVLMIAAGDAVTADARLIDGAALQIAEAPLTGESVPVAKQLQPVALDAVLADRASMVYAGTHVTAGRARAVVTSTGIATEIGRIASLAEGATPQPTPLERRIQRFGRYVVVAAAVLFVTFAMMGVARGLPLAEIAMIGISQVVGLIPEGLPVAMTIALAVGVQRMARRNAIVRRLSAVETLGSTTVICSDKTGTLTRNEMTVTTIWMPSDRTVAVGGIGYGPDGEIAATSEMQPDLVHLLEAGLLCNDARVLGPDEHDPRWRAIGDPTEAALVTLAIKGGLIPDDVRRRMPRRAELPFDSSTKMMATQHDTPSGSQVIVKGAAEAVFALCDRQRVDGHIRQIEARDREAMAAAVEHMAADALRVLAIAEIDGVIAGDLGFAGLRGAVLLGMVGEIDPPRPEASIAVATCRAAGIRPVMVTGDHKLTGVAVARRLGIATAGDLTIDGVELDSLSDEALRDRLDRVAVFARVHPAQKLRIVDAYQARGDVVAMTGDGVNDAPALTRADVGVAMGITGTDVAKEAAKMIVTDDNFGTIVSAVEEGRVAYRNIKKAVVLQIATALAEILVLMLAVALGYPPPFVAVQILWNNLVTEGVITVNLVMDPAEGNEMQQPPVPPGESLVTRSMLWRIAVMTPAIVVATLGWFIYRTSTGVPFEIARSETFTLLAVCEWFNVLNCLSDRRSALNLRLLRNRWLLGGLVLGSLLQVAVIYAPPLNRIFHTVPFGIQHVIAIGAVGSLVLWAEELRKFVVRIRTRRDTSLMPTTRQSRAD